MTSKNIKAALKAALVIGLLLYWLYSTQTTEDDINKCVERSGYSYEYCDLMLNGF